MTEVDDSAWQKALDQWMILARREGKKASTETAYAIASRARQLLSIYPHPPKTKTPSPAGIGPVGRISGLLRASIRNTQGYEGYDVGVGPTRRYARIQELGGWCGKNHRTHLPPRPYWIYAHEIIVHGRRQSIYYQHWLAAQQAVTV
jgi:phage gpG-like protein